MRRVTILDTSVAGDNQGDRIIMEAVWKEVSVLFPDAFVCSVATHEWMGRPSRKLIREADWTIAGGTNLLSSNMWLPRVWKVSPRDALSNPTVTLLGVGWYQFQRSPDPYSRWLIRKMLSGGALHSVRDSYTQSMLAKIGVENCINTGCPTLWGLSPDHCSAIPRRKSAAVVTAINTYLPNVAADAELLRTLRAHYDTIYFWIQTPADFEYSRKLDPSLRYLEPNLDSFDRLLREADVDYVGNRLHAGIRALQHRRRAVIVRVDNRAEAMGRDFGLPTVARGEGNELAAKIEETWETRVSVPVAEIERWRAQFAIA